MATITLTGGDFGSGGSVVVGEEAFYPPDPARPGLNELVPFTAVASVEAVADDRSGQLKEAARLGLRGLTTLGPVGLAASMLAAAKVKDVSFAVRLKDGRGFTATADAVTYAAFGGACRAATGSSEEADEAATRADEMIARYLRERAEAASVQPVAAAPSVVAPVAPEESAGPPRSDDATPVPAPPRRTFGRRGV
jgi:hypothetical protein